MKREIIVLDQREDWPAAREAAPESGIEKESSAPPGSGLSVELVEAKTYLSDARFFDLKSARIFNLCQSYRYQSSGYYVSLLAEARGHRVVPSVTTIEDLKDLSLSRAAADNDLKPLIEKALKAEKAAELILIVAFGSSLDGRFEKIADRLFRVFPAPLLRVVFKKTSSGDEWNIASARALALEDLGPEQRAQVATAAERYFAAPKRHTRSKSTSSFDLAILYDPKEKDAPSDAAALKKFIKAGEELGMDVDLIERDDYARLPEFDGLFIRETTSVMNHTYRFARRAVAEGLVVIDDPLSILRCTNKVFLAELLGKNGVPIPKTLIVHRGNAKRVVQEIGLPCVVKMPDSSFSSGVHKIQSEKDLETTLQTLFRRSDLLIAQPFVPTDFDWRIGVFDKKPLYACKYFMAANHWQIIKRSVHGGHESKESGDYQTMSIDKAPPKVVSAAVKAANLIGDGLYGVDVKQFGDQALVIEVNDNPNVEDGVEDEILGSFLYRTIMEGFLHRIMALRQIGRRPS